MIGIARVELVSRRLSYAATLVCAIGHRIVNRSARITRRLFGNRGVKLANLKLDIRRVATERRRRVQMRIEITRQTFFGRTLCVRTNLGHYS